MENENTATLAHTRVVLPYRPKIDETGAMMLAQNHCAKTFEGVEFWQINGCPSEQMDEWEANGTLAIDIGPRKYNLAGYPSAMDFIAQHYDLALSRGEEALLELANTNNRNGYLKNQHLAIADLMREMYDLEPELNLERDMRIVNAAAHVIQMFIAVANKFEELVEDDIVRGMPVNLLRLRTELQKCADGPLTVGRYLRDMWILGHNPQDIVARVNFWLDGAREIKHEYDRATAEFEKRERFYPTFRVGKFNCLILATGNRFLAKVAGSVKDLSDTKKHRYRVRIIVQPDGHIAVATSGLDISKLAAALHELEPDRWYHQQNIAVMNGSTQYKGVPPTALTANDIKALLLRHPPEFRKRQ